jgi:hypothetical protein
MDTTSDLPESLVREACCQVRRRSLEIRRKDAGPGMFLARGEY